MLTLPFLFSLMGSFFKVAYFCFFKPELGCSATAWLRDQHSFASIAKRLLKLGFCIKSCSHFISSSSRYFLLGDLLLVIIVEVFFLDK